MILISCFFSYLCILLLLYATVCIYKTTHRIYLYKYEKLPTKNRDGRLMEPTRRLMQQSVTKRQDSLSTTTQSIGTTQKRHISKHSTSIFYYNISSINEESDIRETQEISPSDRDTSNFIL